MKIVGLITEYNPFHNGHKYHIEQALKITGSDAAVIIMSGNYVQRGEPAILPKHLRAEIALKCGAAAVFELPVCYATGSAEFFALGAISFLENLGCIDSICFGTESADLDSLKTVAKILCEEPEHYRTLLQKYMKAGNSYPLARQKALSESTDNPSLASFLELPNNILGIEYLKALYRLKSKIIPYALQRIGAGYHTLDLNLAYPSASGIRALLAETDRVTPDILNPFVPQEAVSLFTSKWNTRYPAFADDYSLLLKYKLLSMSSEQLTEYMDISEDLANRILKYRNHLVTFRQFCDLIKTKQLTYTRVSRALLHILLDIRKQDMEIYQQQNFHGYARLLGFRKDTAGFLTIAKGKSRIPILSRLAAGNEIEEPFQTMLKHDIFASNLYESILTEKFKTPFINEYEHPVVRI